MRFPVVVAALLLATVAPATRAVGEVTIYRCTDASGHLTLRDTPCRKGEQQQTRNMIRPTDAPATPPAPSARARRVTGDDAVPRQRTVYITPPRPLYECTTPDGETYTSDSDEGNPRWVPLWTLGYPVARPRHGMTGDTDLAITGGRVRIDDHHTRLYPPFHGAAWGTGTWVRDDCHALPQDEVCSRLVDRRDEIRRRFFNAMPSERDVLRVEERGINARLANDCGGD